jgi:hypothetical protein
MKNARPSLPSRQIWWSRCLAYENTAEGLKNGIVQLAAASCFPPTKGADNTVSPSGWASESNDLHY